MISGTIVQNVHKSLKFISLSLALCLMKPPSLHMRPLYLTHSKRASSLAKRGLIEGSYKREWIFKQFLHESYNLQYSRLLRVAFPAPDKESSASPYLFSNQAGDMPNELTPAMEQYMRFKEQHPDAILLFNSLISYF